jgi:hypothetical protein
MEADTVSKALHTTSIFTHPVIQEDFIAQYNINFTRNLIGTSSQHIQAVHIPFLYTTSDTAVMLTNRYL